MDNVSAHTQQTSQTAHLDISSDVRSERLKGVCCVPFLLRVATCVLGDRLRNLRAKEGRGCEGIE